jgi:hypothetical protein
LRLQVHQYKMGKNSFPIMILDTNTVKHYIIQPKILIITNQLSAELLEFLLAV